MLGIFTFYAPYLPWVLLAFTVLLNNVFPAGDLLGMAVAHVYYFLEDVYPRMDGSHGRRLLQTPDVVKWLFDGNVSADAADTAVLPDRWYDEPDDLGPGEDVPEVKEKVLDEPEVKETLLDDHADSSGPLRQRTAVEEKRDDS